MEGRGRLLSPGWRLEGPIFYGSLWLWCVHGYISNDVPVGQLFTALFAIVQLLNSLCPLILMAPALEGQG